MKIDALIYAKSDQDIPAASCVQKHQHAKLGVQKWNRGKLYQAVWDTVCVVSLTGDVLKP